MFHLHIFDISCLCSTAQKLKCLREVLKGRKEGPTKVENYRKEGQ